MLSVLGCRQLLALVENVGRERRFLGAGRNGVLLAVAKIDNLVQKVVVIRLGLLSKSTSAHFVKRGRGRLAAHLVPVVSIWVEMRPAERVELLDDSLLVLSLGFASLSSICSSLLRRPLAV